MSSANELIKSSCEISARNSARQNSVLREDIKGNGSGKLGNPCMLLQKQLQDSMLHEIEEHWAEDKTKEKFTQLRR